MSTAGKKSSTKAVSGKKTTSTHPSHPSWVEMIKECIIAHPDEARGGVSRPMIKKFVEARYNIEVNATAASQLNRAITSGSERGTFVLPKGPSGKVKLTPKIRGEAAKENSKPVSKAKVPVAAKTTVKSTTNKTKPVAAKGKATSAPPVKKKKVLAGRPKAAVPKKSTSPSKRASAKKAAIGKKPTVKKPSKSATGKKATQKASSDTKPTKSKAKPKTKAKAKPRAATAKTKPASKASAKPKSVSKKEKAPPAAT